VLAGFEGGGGEEGGFGELVRGEEGVGHGCRLIIPGLYGVEGVFGRQVLHGSLKFCNICVY
jgi:hypothetical protein